MELQNDKELCRLTNKELNAMIKSTYDALIIDKTTGEKKCTYVFEEDTYKSHFLASNQNDANTIFLSIDSLLKYHPLYYCLCVNYPNRAKALMQDDTLLCLKMLVFHLASAGYKMAIRDSFFDESLTYELLAFLKGLGYSTQLVVYKKDAYMVSMKSIYNYAISLITRLHNVSISSVTVPIKDLVGYMNQGFITSGCIMDSLVNFIFKMDKNGPNLGMAVNAYADILEPAFYEKFENLQSFIEEHKRYLTDEEYQELTSLLESLKNSYYDSIDISFLVQDKGR